MAGSSAAAATYLLLFGSRPNHHISSASSSLLPPFHVFYFSPLFHQGRVNKYQKRQPTRSKAPSFGHRFESLSSRSDLRNPPGGSRSPHARRKRPKFICPVPARRGREPQSRYTPQAASFDLQAPVSQDTKQQRPGQARLRYTEGARLNLDDRASRKLQHTSHRHKEGNLLHRPLIPQQLSCNSYSRSCIVPQGPEYTGGSRLLMGKPGCPLHVKGRAKPELLLHW